MGKAIRTTSSALLKEIQSAIGFHQPRLCAGCEDGSVIVRGTFLVLEPSVVASPTGPITTFDIKIIVPAGFPQREAQVYETGGRIPRSPDRHINTDGDCCVTVWEHWLASADDHSFAAFLNGPVHAFFLGQHYFETTGRWPFGEWSHGRKGLEEAYAELLGIPVKRNEIIYRLRLLSLAWPKGHWLCPCGSGRRLRHCHHAEMMDLHRKVPPKIARRMLRRLKSFGN